MSFSRETPPPILSNLKHSLIISRSYSHIRIISQEVRMTYEAEISSLKVVIQEEKAVRAEMARRHKAELEDLKKDIAEKVCWWNGLCYLTFMREGVLLSSSLRITIRCVTPATTFPSVRPFFLSWTLLIFSRCAPHSLIKLCK